VPTLERLRHPDQCGTQRPLVLLVGADAFAGLPDWHRWEEIFKLAHIAVAHRPGVPLDTGSLPESLAGIYRERYSTSPAALAEAPAGRIVTFAMTQLAISATQIRSLLANGRSPRYLLPDAVIAYIQSTFLYSPQ
jgi:nicotinate-nucleotide adenylyltransferase